MVALLWIGSLKFGEVARFDQRFITRSVRITAASVTTGLAVSGAFILFEPWFFSDSWRYLALLLLVLFGALVYFVAALVIGALNLKELRSAVRRSA